MDANTEKARVSLAAELGSRSGCWPWLSPWSAGVASGDGATGAVFSAGVGGGNDVNGAVRHLSNMYPTVSV